MHSAASIANAFLSKAFKEKKTISPMKIQKLLYLAQGFYLVETDLPLMNEVFEAWRFGPVLDTVYHKCKHFGQKGIPNYLNDYDFDTGKFRPAPFPDEEKVKEVVDFVWEAAGDTPAMELSVWTHQKDGPWAITTDGGTKILLHQEVPNDLIKEYFKANCYE